MQKNCYINAAIVQNENRLHPATRPGYLQIAVLQDLPAASECLPPRYRAEAVSPQGNQENCFPDVRIDRPAPEQWQVQHAIR